MFVLALGCRQASSPTNQPPGADDGPDDLAAWFEDVTPASGIRFTYRNGREAGKYSILESLGGGVALFDYDCDGDLDVFATGGGKFETDYRIVGLPAGLFANQGDLHFDDATRSAAIPASRGYTHGVTSADIDNDGFADLLVTGYGHLQLLHNRGDGTFHDVTDRCGLADEASRSWNTAAGWGDFDGDGDLDLYVARYVDWSPTNDPRCPPRKDLQQEVCSPIQFAGLPDVLYWNQGDGTFVADPAAVATDEPGKGLGVLVADLDNDGDVDIYVANDTTQNFLFENDGRGAFREQGLLRGVALDNAGVQNGSMGVALTDIDADGLPEIGVANYEREMFALYRRRGGTFVHASQDTGLAASGNLTVGWGTAFVDLDGDGDRDLVVSNGHVLYHPENTSARQTPTVWECQGQKFRLLQFPPDHYLGSPHHGRGMAAGDLNNDGAVDLVFSHNNERLTVLANRRSEGVRTALVRLVGVHTNRDAIGARLMYVNREQDREQRQSRQAVGSSSYLSQDDRRIAFALGTGDSAGQLTITWPRGGAQQLELVPTNSRPVIIEGSR